MNIRTDLVSEETVAEIPGIESKTVNKDGVTIESAEVKTDSAARQINKQKGKYFTIKFGRLDTVVDTAPIKGAIISALGELAGGKNDNALIVGLGNADITPDALGPLCAGRILATRHISKELKTSLGLSGLHTVSVIVPGVLGKTGIEAADIIKATARRIRPDIVLAVDALAARTPENLCRTVQLTDSGIAPGSGVKNSRRQLNRDTLGVPVIAIGVPTVIDAKSVLEGMKTDGDMMVTPKEIDLLVSRAADITARSINMFFQPSLSEETIESLS